MSDQRGGGRRLFLPRLSMIRYHEESLLRMAQECRLSGQWTERSILLVVGLDDDVGSNLLRGLGVHPTPAPISAGEIPTALGICDSRLLALLLEGVQPAIAQQILAPLPDGMAYVLAVALGGAM